MVAKYTDNLTSSLKWVRCETKFLGLMLASKYISQKHVEASAWFSKKLNEASCNKLVNYIFLCSYSADGIASFFPVSSWLIYHGDQVARSAIQTAQNT